MLAHRTKATGTLLSALALGLTGAWLAAGVVASRGAIGIAPNSASGPALPDRMAISGPMPAGVTQQPAGPAIAAYLDDDDNEQWWVFVGADRSSYRSFPAGSYYPDNKRELLLSPDGTRAAAAAFDVEREGWVVVVNLVSGDTRRVPGLQLSDDDAPLAWSPNNQYLALRSGDRLAIADITSGQVTRFGVDADRAAFSPSGDRIAVSLTDRVAIVDAANGDVLSTHPVGEYAVAPAGWSPDGSTIALQPREGAATRPLARLDLANGSVRPASAETEGKSAVAWRSNSDLVVTAPGRPTLSTYDVSSGRVALLSENSSDWYSTSHGLRMATSLVPKMQVVAAGRVDRGHTYSWYVAWLVVGIGMVAVGRWWPRPGSERRRSDLYLVAKGVLTTPAMAVVGLLPILILLEAASQGGQLNAFGLTGFSYLIAECLAVVLLGGAGLLAGLLSRRNPGPMPAAPLPRPLISASG